MVLLPAQPRPPTSRSLSVSSNLLISAAHTQAINPIPITKMGGDEEHSLPELSTIAPDAEQTRSRPLESNRTKLSVLIGSGIIQLPIWGTL